MLTADRFLVRQTDYDAWLEARRHGVSATSVASAATPSGFRETVDNWGVPVEENAYMSFGKEAESELMRYAHQHHGILPSDWLIAGGNPRHLATPDGMSVDHTVLAECKTTGKDWAAPPIKYRRQCQWQMHVTGAERCLLVWNLRVPDEHGWFYLGWIEPKTLWIERDEDMIRDLVGTADRLWEALSGELQPC